MNANPLSDNTLSLVEIDCRELILGMYVSDLDCNWSDTPFPLGGFHVRTAEDIQVLLKYCQRIVIDLNKGAAPRQRRKHQLTILSSARKSAPPANKLKIDRGRYEVSHSVKQLIDRAWEKYSSLKAGFSRVCHGVRQGEGIKLHYLSTSGSELVKVIIANPETVIWLLNTDPEEPRPTDYCVRAALWATILARQVGMSQEHLETVFLGTLLSDIGLQMLPERLVMKTGHFRRKECLAYRKHVAFSANLIGLHPELNDAVKAVAENHHERNDGLGFPRGIKGELIPVHARIAHIAYSFERLLRNNSSRGRRVPMAKALSRLYKQRGLKFSEQLVVEFIHALGMYPAGTLVNLTSGEVAIVLEQNEQARMQPRVAILVNSQGEELTKPDIVNLACESGGQSNMPSIISESAQPGGPNPRDFTFSFWGKKLALGSFSLRL